MEKAEDYLLEFINDEKCNKWTEKLISAFLSGKKEEYITPLANELLGIGVCDISDLNIENRVCAISNVWIKELIHNAGVSALAENQKIKFCSSINVIYGLNGTGKSSYFRILNELIGGKRETPILPNIYISDSMSVSVSLKYFINNSDRNITWNGEGRGIDDLLPIRVFDSKYNESMLKKRESDELVVQPYGLGIFEEISDYISEIALKAETIIDSEEAALPNISWTNVSEEMQQLFEKESFSDDELTQVRALFEKLSDIDFDREIESLNDEISKLRIANPKERLERERGLLKRYISLSQRLTELDKEVRDRVVEIKKIIDTFICNKQSSEMFKKNIEILHNIPGSDSLEWKNFIASGEKYMSVTESNGICPYCRRPYDESSVELIKAYAEFISNDAEQKLKTSLEALVNIKEEILAWNVNIPFDHENVDDSFLKLILSYESEIKEIRETLLSDIDNKNVSNIRVPKIEKIVTLLNELIKKCQDAIQELSQDSEGREKLISDKIKIINDKKSDQSLMKLSCVLLSMIQQKNMIKLHKGKIGELPRVKTTISKLSTRAHQELLTEQLQQSFTENLEALIRRSINVELKGKTSAGKQQTELTICNKKDVTNILSEGEQKAAALALFLAEIKMSKNKSSIIFDDPVNSLDHKIISTFTDMLMDLDNQLIIFTHNKLFLDSIETSSKGHVCKGIESACNKTKGKHIYLYETQSESRTKKGVIAEKAKENARWFISRAEIKLQQSPFTESEAVCSNLRHAIEAIIDEKIFNNQVPNKFSNKNARINWIELKNLNPDESIINRLNALHSRCSGGELHIGSEREENPVDKEELLMICEELTKFIE